MSTTAPVNAEAILAARVDVPGHVVYRSFAAETVLLNLETGQYHGVNAVGGQMIHTLERCDTVRDALDDLRRQFDVPPPQLEQDLCEFCRDLSARGLIEISRAPAAER
jgi:hypothetical protein